MKDLSRLPELYPLKLKSFIFQGFPGHFYPQAVSVSKTQAVFY